MDAEDDDFYASGEAAQGTKEQESENDDDNGVKEEKMEDELEEGEEEESDDSDIEIITDRKDEPPQPQPHYSAIKQEQNRAPSADQASRIQQQSTISKISSTPAATAPQKLQDGSKYPEVRTTTVDVNVNPVWEPVGKPITQIDIDADMAEHNKPWRLPGSDQSDYFNYGFDEFTWASYVIRQETMAKALESQKAETAQFQQFFGGGGMPGMPGAPAAPAAQQQGAPAMPGMPNEQEMMQMAQYMMAAGQDPSQMDFNTFMQQANAASGSYGGQAQAQGGYGNYGNQNQGGGQAAAGGAGGAGGGNAGGNYGGGGRGGRRGRW